MALKLSLTWKNTVWPYSVWFTTVFNDLVQRSLMFAAAVCPGLLVLAKKILKIF